ncbi:MAG: hypothetical protein WDZ35_03915 [Crocinitomicaceae bacterium]
MKTFKQIVPLLLAVVILPTSCKKETYLLDEPVPVGIGINNAYVLGAEYLSHNGDELYIDLNVGVVGTGSHIDIVDLPDSAFSDMDMGYYHLILEDVIRMPAESEQNYSNFTAIDYSTSWDDFDAFNTRTKSLTKFIDDGKKDSLNELAFGSFKRYEDGSSFNPIWVYDESKNAFQQSADDAKKIIFDDYYSTIGYSSSLYDALEKFLSYTDGVAVNDKKSITALCTTAPDNLNAFTTNEIITIAQAYGIQINLILFGDYFDNQLIRMPALTGGFINMISNTSDFQLTLGGLMDKGAPIIGSLHRILSESQAYYKLKLKLLRKSGSWNSGNVIYSYYETNLKSSNGEDRLNNLLPFYVQLP